MIVAMHVIAVQVDTVWEDKEATHRRIEELLRAVEVTAESLVVLPEMFATGFSVDLPVVLDDAQIGVSHAFLKSLAVRHRCFVVGGVVVSTLDGRGRNQAVAFGPDGDLIVRYTKVHPFTYGGEAKVIEAGDQPVFFDVAALTVCPMICYDLRFPELFRCGVRQGAQVFLLIANWPASRHDHWRTLARARAIENQAWVVAVNRCGRDPNLEYAGGSAIIDPRGARVVEAGGEQQVLVAEINGAELQVYRAEFPALLDMRDRFFPPR